MQLPAELRARIEAEVSAIPPAALKTAAAGLSAAYRQGAGRSNLSLADGLAYAVTRMPATYAAAAAVFPEAPPFESLLDLGAGPGTASLAAIGARESLRAITLVEREPALIDLGQRLWTSPHAAWIRADLSGEVPYQPHDAVILSYALGELPEPARLRVIVKAWAAAGNMLIVIEPGTVPGFERLLKIRSHLIEQGAHIAAPCPHGGACPMEPGDWCHFGARVERTALHRRLKAADLNYEDEKYSYVIACRQPANPAPARILRRPAIHPGLIELTLCTPAGLEQRQIRKRDRALWPLARKAFWGGRMGQ